MTYATCVPLDRRLGADAARDLFADLRLDALILAQGDDSQLAAAARGAGIPLVRLDAQAGDPAGVFRLHGGSGRAPVQPTPPRPDDVSLVMHTSGTTARPKLVPLTHIQNLWSATVHAIDCHDRCLALTPLYTKSALGQCLLVPLAAGASVVYTPGFDAAQIVDWLDTFRPTFYTASPTIQRAILEAVARRRPTAPLSLRFVRASSSALPASLQDEIEATLGVPVVQGYGSTEGGLVAQNVLPPGRRPRGSVGLALCADVAILGASGERLPPGETGEIVVRGPGVMRGYENDAEANRLAFHDGWFRTGDLGYRDADGYFYIVGRAKELINRGGLKVAPAEVDEVVQRHPAVREAATCGVAHGTLGEDVVTAVILRAPGAATPDELREFALRHLVPSKAPSAIVLVDDLPRTGLGKVRRRELAQSLRPAFVAPANTDESLVAAVFASVLHLPPVGARDNFFNLGGDSLRATQALSRISAQTGVALDRLAVFAAPTAEALARSIGAARAAAGAVSPAVKPPLVRRNRGPFAPLGAARKAGED